MDFQTRYVFDPKKDLLGKGGFSKVYKANDSLLERTVALKFFTAKSAEKYQVLNEIKKVIRFEHSNLCKYYDVAVLSYKNVLDETEQMEVGIMEYIDAGDIKNFLKKNPEATDKLLIDVLKGLAYLHKYGMAHRDLKPQNILVKMVDDEPVAKITDFGISKKIDSEDGNSSTLLGTIEYMAPEQFNPRKYGINGRIATNLDMWSYGILVYEVICHESLFGSRSSGVSAEQVMSNILSDMATEKAEALPPRYREVVKRCLVKNAADRVMNALELIPLLQAADVEEKVAPEQQSTDADRTSTIETEMLDTEVSDSGEVTQTVLPPPDLGDNLEVTELPKAELSVLVSAEEEEVDPFAVETSVLQPVAGTSELTQALPNITPLAEEETQVIQTFSQVKEEEKEEQKTFTRRNIIIPTENKTPERPWSQKVERGDVKKNSGQLKKRLLLLSAALLILILFFVFAPAKKSDSLPPRTTAPAPRPVAPGFTPPQTLPVAGGMFTMGDQGDPGAPLHQVILDDFELGKHEVTIGEFREFIRASNYVTTAEQNKFSIAFINGNWDYHANNINWRQDVFGALIPATVKTTPVVHVSWQDAAAYCQWLSEKTGQKYRLPTEAEWEFAARGGNRSGQFSFSGSNQLEEVGWFEKNSGLAVNAVGQKKANELGLFDMSGNASEWCADFFDREFYTKSASLNPVNTKESGMRVNRGGATGAAEKYCKVGKRFYFDENTSGGTIGFRICKEK